MIYVFSVKVRVDDYELDDILHSTYDVSSVVEYFESIGIRDSNMELFIKSNGVYYYNKRCVIDMEYDSSNINSLDGYHEMYNIIKPFYRNEKIKKLGI
jgi:hypothetical protein